MIEIEINKENLKKFIDDISPEDKEELKYFYKKDFKKKFIKIALENKNNCSYFLADNNKTPVAVGGVCKINNEKQKTGQIWLLVTNKAKKHRFFLYKYIKRKIVLFKTQYDFLFNYIFKSNFKALIWLKKCGFKARESSDINYKLFYFDKGEKF